VVAGAHVSDYALNLAQVSLFRRGGFFATVLLRVSFYLIWHVVWGGSAEARRQCSEIYPLQLLLDVICSLF